jgi:hypothetical protein
MIQDKLSEIAKKYGVRSAIKTVGSINRYIKLMYNSDLSEFYKKSQLVPYMVSNDRMSFYIDDFIVQRYGFEDLKYSSINGSKSIGNFRFGTKDNLMYRFDARIYPCERNNGQKMWKVVGTSGDYGFGYRYISKKNTLGVRHRTQIYNQIIERFKLNDYLQ